MSAESRTPVVSVLLPLYGNEGTVAETIRSVQEQSFADWELIVVDDESPDRSAQIVQGIASSDPRIRLLRRENGGPAAARNTGIADASGAFCAFIDGDDLWFPDKLERQLRIADDRTVVFTDAHVDEDGERYPYGLRVYQEPGRYPKGDVFEALLDRNFIPFSTVLAPLLLVRSVGGLDVGLRYTNDWDLLLRLSLAGAVFDYVAEPLAVYRLQHGGMSSSGGAIREDSIRALSQLERRTDGGRRSAVRKRLRRARREFEVHLRKSAWVAAVSGDLDSARRGLLASARCNPRSLRGAASLLLLPFPPLLAWVARRRLPASFGGDFVGA